MATPHILAVGKIVDGDVHWRVAPLTPAAPSVTDDDVDTLIDEVYGKPGLGVEDSAGLFDVMDDAPDAYSLGLADYTNGHYRPPAGNAEHDAYIRGYNDAWAAANAVAWWRKGSGQ